MRLNTKIFLSFLPGIFMAMFLGGVFVYPSFKFMLQESTSENRLLIAQQMLDTIERLLNERYNDIQEIAGEKIFLNYLNGKTTLGLKSLSSRMSDWMALSGPWDALLVVDKAGKILLSSEPRFVGRRIDQDQDDAIIFRRTLQGITYYSDFLFSKRTGSPTVIFAAPVLGSGQDARSIQGAVIGYISWPVIREILSGTTDQSHYQLYNKAGVLIGDNDSRSFSGVPKRGDTSDAGRSFLKTGTNGVSIVPSSAGEGQNLVVAAIERGHLNYKGNGWTLVSETPLDVAFSRVFRLIHLSIVVFFLCIGLSFLVAMIIVMSAVSKPIARFTSMLRGIASGDFSRRIAISSQDEIGELAGAFNQMLDDLRETTVSKEYISNIVNSMVESVLVIDSDGKIKMANEAVLTLLGFEEKELLGASVNSVLEEKDATQLSLAVLKELVRYFSLRDYQAVYRTKSGERIPVFISGADLIGASGEFSGIVLVADMRLAERRLVGQNAITRALAEAATMSEAIPKLLKASCESGEWVLGEFWKVDAESGVLRFVDSWHAPGIEVDEFTAISRDMTFPPGIGLPGRVWATGKAAWITNVVRDPNFPRSSYAAKANLHGAFGLPLVFAGNVLGVIEFFSQNVREPDQQFLEMMESTGRQIGQLLHRMRAEAALRESEERIHLLLDSTAEAICAVDLQGDCILANRSCVEVLGYERVEELLGQNMHRLTHYSRSDGTPLPVEHCPIRRAGQQGKIAHIGNEVFWRRDRSSIQVECWVHPLRVGDRLAGSVVSFMDVTDRRKLEAMVTQSEKLSAVGQLAAGVAHEINNPLAVILGFAQSMAKKVQEGEALALPVKSIEREALRCKKLVQNLLAFSRQDRPRMEALDFNNTVTDTLGMVEAQARVKAVEVVRELGDVCPAFGDKNQLQQIIINLCNNAIDAMPDGGRLIVRTRQAGAGADLRTILEVEDTGSGIPENVRDKIFNPFFTTKEVGKGTGLGLSLVHEIVKKHQGDIELKSEVGKGTIFTVSLPAHGGEDGEVALFE